MSVASAHGFQSGIVPGLAALLQEPAEDRAASGFPIGLIESDYEERRLSLNPGDRLYLYSDGVTEAFNAADQQFGTEGLLAALGPDHTGPLDQSVKSLVGRVEAWGGPPRDDLSVLALEIDVHGSTQA